MQHRVHHPGRRVAPWAARSFLRLQARLQKEAGDHTQECAYEGLPGSRVFHNVTCSNRCQELSAESAVGSWRRANPSACVSVVNKLNRLASLGQGLTSTKASRRTTAMERVVFNDKMWETRRETFLSEFEGSGFVIS